MLGVPDTKDLMMVARVLGGLYELFRRAESPDDPQRVDVSLVDATRCEIASTDMLEQGQKRKHRAVVTAQIRAAEVTGQGSGQQARFGDPTKLFFRKDPGGRRAWLAVIGQGGTLGASVGYRDGAS